MIRKRAIAGTEIIPAAQVGVSHEGVRLTKSLDEHAVLPCDSPHLPEYLRKMELQLLEHEACERDVGAPWVKWHLQSATLDELDSLQGLPMCGIKSLQTCQPEVVLW